MFKSRYQNFCQSLCLVDLNQHQTLVLKKSLPMNAHLKCTVSQKKIHSVFSHSFVNGWRQSGMFFWLTVYILNSIKLRQNLSWKHTRKVHNKNFKKSNCSILLLKRQTNCYIWMFKLHYQKVISDIIPFLNIKIIRRLVSITLS